MTADLPRMTPYGAPWRPPASSKERVSRAGQATFRRIGTATARWRTDPDYFVIGTKRGGTTSLARWLLDHPDVRSLYPAMEHRKGTYFFDVNHDRGHAWYRSHFPVRAVHEARGRLRGRRQLIGDATPYYLHHPDAPARAAAAVPNARVIALLRHPVDRAHGHWAERTRNGVETLSFAEALRAEPERLRTHPEFAHQHWSYVDQGRYVHGLRRWFEHYPAEQILVLRSEDLYADPAAVYDQVLDFLGLPPHRPEAFAAWNLRDKDPIDPADRAVVEDALADDVAQLESFLGRSLDWEGFER